MLTPRKLHGQCHRAGCNGQDAVSSIAGSSRYVPFSNIPSPTHSHFPFLLPSSFSFPPPLPSLSPPSSSPSLPPSPNSPLPPSSSSPSLPSLPFLLHPLPLPFSSFPSLPSFFLPLHLHPQQEFYFKCANHRTEETEECVALHMVRANTINVECASCLDVG